MDHVLLLCPVRAGPCVPEGWHVPAVCPDANPLLGGSLRLSRLPCLSVEIAVERPGWGLPALIRQVQILVQNFSVVRRQPVRFLGGSFWFLFCK